MLLIAIRERLCHAGGEPKALAPHRPRAPSAVLGMRRGRAASAPSLSYPGRARGRGSSLNRAGHGACLGIGPMGSNTLGPIAGMGLAAVLASVLQGCCTGSVCGCEASTFEDTRTTTVSDERLDLLADGDLSDADCEKLCRDLSFDATVLSCRDLGISSQAEGGAGAGGGPVVSPHDIECHLEEIAYCEGRRHAAVRARAVGRGPSEVAAWLTRAAQCEASSARTFALLASELRALGAPVSLVEAARRAAVDEVRHARAMDACASARRATRRSEIPRARRIRRGLFELALENAVEGCVRETFAALVAMHQAERAESPAIRAAMRPIAADEIRHGELAWAIHRWALTQLDEGGAAALRRAVREAGEQLASGAAAAPIGAPARRALGLPDPSRSAALARAAAVALWS